MTTRTDDGVNAYFRACVKDRTPVAAPPGVRLLYAPVAAGSDTDVLCSSVLAEAELQRAKRFTGIEQRSLFVQRRAFRRFCGAVALGCAPPLSAVEFEVTAAGRPFLSEATELWFSFASSRAGMLAAWSSLAGVGVDIEDCSQALDALALAHAFFSSTEAALIETLGEAERRHAFYRLWTLKEAALKSIGKGLPFGLDTFHFNLEPNARLMHAPADYGGTGGFHLHELDRVGTTAALVIRSGVRAISCAA